MPYRWSFFRPVPVCSCEVLLNSYQKCYNKENDEYDLDFVEIVKDKELRKIGDKLKIWDYLYDIYWQCKKAINILIDNKNADVFNIGKKYIEDKYFK